MGWLRRRVLTARRVRVCSEGVVALLLGSLVAIVPGSGPASAAGIGMTKTAPASVLVGGDLPFTLTATNPAGGTAVPEYNVAFRDVLPLGVTYVAGSTAPSTVGEPTVYTDATTGRQTLVWEDVSDLPVGASEPLSFHTTVDPSVLPVGSTVSNTANTYANSDPRKLPRFSATGTLVAASATESATSNTTSTSIGALTLDKSEPSPEHELVRGVHDNTTVYTLTATNNGAHATNAVTVTDYLPAALEFLGCGTDDNSAAREYPGAPPLSAAPDVPTDCPTPTSVTTVTDPPGKPAGVYTKVTWSLGTLAAGAVVRIKYRAGIPLRENVATFPGTIPTPASGQQGSNLDNNTGPSTRELTNEQSLTNRADIAGTYSGPVATGALPTVTDTAQQTVTIEDLALVKSVTPTSFNGGGVATYTLTIRTGEYADASGIVVKDHLPNGLCPLDTTQNYALGSPATCGPGAAFGQTGAGYSTVVANADGTFDITFSPVAVSHDGTATITYKARMRASYAGGGPGSDPTSSGDDFTNTAALTGTTVVRDDVNAPGPTGPLTVGDDSSATLTSDAPAMSKRIQPQVTPYSCSDNPGDYIKPPDPRAPNVTFGEGSRVCFLIHVDFSASNSTKNPVVTDFLPPDITYEAGSATPTVNNTVAGSVAGTGPLSWAVGTTSGSNRFVAPGGVFEWKLSGIVTTPAAGPAPDKTANLAKLTWTNTNGKVAFLRDEVDLSVAAPPPVSVLKSAVRVVGTPAGNVPEGGTVRADQVLEYTVAVTNGGTAANRNNDVVVGPDVWDVLPAGVTCALITVISDSGACTNPGDPGQPTFTGSATLSAIRWNLPDSVQIAPGATRNLTYRMQIPSSAGVSTTYVNKAAVASYGSVTNLGGTSVAQHAPATNIDTTTPAATVDAPAAQDTHTVKTPDATISKTNTTSITEAGNATVGQAVVGEQVTYTISAKVPAHTSVYDATLTDLLPPGLTFLSADAGFSATGAQPTGALPPGFSQAANGNLTFPSTYANTTDTDQLFTVTIVARVDTSATNVNGAALTNNAAFNSKTAPGGTAIATRKASSTVGVVEPQPTLTKHDDDADGTVVIGQSITYTLTATNTAGRPPLHDSIVKDCVPVGLSVTGIVSTSVGTATFAVSDGTNGCLPGETRVVWVLPDLAGGATQTLKYTATPDPNSAGARVFTNHAALTGSTLKDGKTDPQAPDNPLERTYESDATDTVRTADAAITKSTTTPARTIGQRASYTTTVTLPSGTNFFDAAVIDQLPAGLDPATLQTSSVVCTFADSTPCSVGSTVLTPTAGPSGSTLIGWGLGDLTQSAQTRTVTVSYTAVVADVASDVRGAQLTNSARVLWDQTNHADPTSTGATFDNQSTPASAVVTVTEPVLAIAKAVSDPTPAPGEVFTYTVDVTDDGSLAHVSAAYNVTVVDTVPDGVVVHPGSISQGGVLAGQTASGGGTITWTLAGPINAAQTVALTYDAELSSPTRPAARTNTADITHYESLPSGGRSYDGPSASATVTPGFPHVDIDKQVLGGPIAYLGESKAWRLTVTSDGAVRAFGIDAHDTLPVGWTYDAGSARVSVAGGPATPVEPVLGTSGGHQTLTWTDLGDLPVGQTVVVDFTSTPGAGVVDDPGVGQSVDQTNTATPGAEDANGNSGPAGGGTYAGPADTAVAHIDSADVRIAKTHVGTPVAGQDFTWTLTVSNTGPDPAVGPFTVTDPVPAAVTNASGSGNGWTCSTAGGTVTCTRSSAGDTLASGDSFPPITLVGHLPAAFPPGSQLSNTASVTDRTFDPDHTNNSATDTVGVGTEADLSIVKRLSGAMVAGQDASYTLDVANNGPSVHHGEVTVTDQVPAGTSYVTASGAGWSCDEAGGTVTCTRNDDRPLGAMPQIIVTVLVDSDRTADVVNSAHVTGTTDDPDPSNNDSTVTTSPDEQADLGLEKSHLGSFVAGSNGVYRFTVTNQGPSTARPSVRITDTLPVGETYVGSADVTGVWTCSAAGRDLTCTLTGPLASGDDAVVDVTVAVGPDVTESLHNTATVSSPTDDPNPANNTDDDDTGVDARSDLVIQKSHTGTVVAGGTATYTLAVRNDGPSDSPGPITVTDVLPDGMGFNAAAGTGWTCDHAGQTITCVRPATLANGASAPDITVVADVAPDAGPATLVNRASVDGPAADPTPANNSDQDPTDVVDHANVSVTKRVTGADPVDAGATTSFEIVAHDDGPSDADTVTVTDTLPSAMTVVSASGPGWDCQEGQTIVCSRPTLAAGADSPPITVTARVASGVADGTTLTNTASISTTTSGDDPADNDASADVTVGAEADLALTKSHATGTVSAGEQTQYQIAVYNNGPSDAVGPLVVTDDLPDGLSYLSASGPWACDAAGQDVTCTLAQDLVAGADAPGLTLRVQVAADVDAGPIVNIASVDSATHDPLPANNTDAATVTVGQSADLSVTKSHVGSAAAGQPLDFALAVHNDGPSEARQVEVVDTLPDGMTYGSSTGTDWTCTPTGQVVTCDLAGPLAPGADAPALTVTVDLADTAFGTLTNQADVSASTPDPDAGNNHADDPVDVTPEPGQLSLVKRASAPVDANHDGRLDAGDTIDYTFEVTDTGTVPIDHLVVHDDKVGSVRCPKSSLLPAESMTCRATYTLTQRDLDRGSVTNHATVTGDNPAGATVTSDPDQVTTPLPGKPGLTIVKHAHLLDRDGDGRADAGERIVYTFVVTNVGNTTLTHVAVVDRMLARAGDAIRCPQHTLAPGGSMTCRATYTVTAADLDSAILNTATATGTDPGGGPTTSPPDHATVPVDAGNGPSGPPNPPGTLPNTGGPRLLWLELGVAALLLGCACVALASVAQRGARRS